MKTKFIITTEDGLSKINRKGHLINCPVFIFVGQWFPGYGKENNTITIIGRKRKFPENICKNFIVPILDKDLFKCAHENHITAKPVFCEKTNLIYYINPKRYFSKKDKVFIAFETPKDLFKHYGKD